MSKVFAIDSDKRPLDPIHPARARQLLRNGKAAIFRKYPFTVILKDSYPEASVSPLRLKIDPGAGASGMALVNDATGEVVWAGQLQHRGFQIRDALTSRRQLRRSRRSRKTRYRAPRFLNRTRSKGWLPPSLQSRVENIKTWVAKLRKFTPITALSQELARFDTQLMQNSNISGVEYQQGTLTGYETREYLLQKWHRQCAYCDAKDIPLQIEHIHPKCRGGSDRISNLCLACEQCNVAKGNKPVEQFLKSKPEVLKRISAQAKRSLADTAAVNTTRFALLDALKETGLPVEVGTGGTTKFNRTQQNLEKTHWADAACVGASTPQLLIKGVRPLLIAAKGHGTRQSCRVNKYGFPIRHCSREKLHFGFQTGDIVQAIVPSGKKAGTHIGRLATRASGSFNVSTKDGLVQGISRKFCTHIHKKDGYSYVA